MARRRQERLVVELVPDEDDDAAAAGAPSEPGEPGHAVSPARAALARWRGLTRRTRVLVAAGTAVAVLAVGGGAAVADAVGDHRRAVAMRTVAGGVTDLSVPPVQTWEADVVPFGAVPVEGGAVVVRDGEDVLALDAATGEERWRHRVGESDDVAASCGRGSGDPSAPAAQVVCLAGTDGDLVATVITADGAVLGSRDLGAVAQWGGGRDGDAEGLPQVIPVADDMLVVLEDPVDPTRTFDDLAGARAELRRLREAGSLPAVRLDDALTGEVLARGEIDLDVDGLDGDALASCAVYQGATATSPSLMQHSSVMPGAVWTTLCGAGVAVTTEGDVVEFESDDAWSIGRTDAGLVVPSPSGSTLRTDDGDVELPGRLMPALVDDGSDDVLLVSEEAGGLRGVKRDGTVRWSTGSSGWVLARAGGVGVALGGSDGSGGRDGPELVGLDLSDGAERWRRHDVLPELTEDTSLVGVATDGVRVLLAVGRSDGFELVAVDARTGARVWHEAYDTGPLVNLTTVDGNLMMTTMEDGGGVLRGLAS
ncbi:PQQ-binding-like beta-propeller repeat protein [Isoptericola sp. BMS4]|uniref:outer membrane protein assembly factor BamB family protein n=1 Tax=Isoptericola sp. BMS4 TaxID=2527875 RepID=UPI00196AE1EB|nr:PQQ-binding-like beta-propeller repeat protein [Isoptericola sp. BMS4]